MSAERDNQGFVLLIRSSFFFRGSRRIAASCRLASPGVEWCWWYARVTGRRALVYLLPLPAW